MSEYTYVPLDRRFVDIGVDDPEDDPTSDLLLRMRGEKPGQPWDKLLEQDVAIILGSAGSGKTAEIRQQTKRLREAGIPAFSVRMEALCRQTLEKSFFPDDGDSYRVYSQWKRKGGEAVVFLDALDEARLPAARNGSVLADAFANLSEGVGRSGASLKVVLTTRGSEWQGQPDLDTVRTRVALLRFQEKDRDSKEKPEVRFGVFRITPLGVEDIRAIAESRGVDAEAFLNAVGQSLSANLLRQPLEVHFLIDVWSEEIRRENSSDDIFSSRAAVFSKVVSSRLRSEQNGERRSDVDPIMAQRACEKLAAAVVISGVRDISPTGDVEGTLSALDILANDNDRWNERDVRQVLSCALFHPSVAGKIRFSHREIQDYLAACFFNRAVDENAGSLDVVDPLIAKGFGAPQIPQETEHVAGWLATLNPVVRPYITRLKPALLIETGDPLSLTPEEKIRALEAQVALYEERNYRGEWFYREDIRRFASAELAPAVRKFLNETSSPEVRDFLVEVARYGQMRELGPVLASIAQRQDEPVETRTEACFALAEFSDTQYAEGILEALLLTHPPEHEDPESAPAWNTFVVSVLGYVYPSAAEMDDVRCALERIRREPRNHTSSTSRHFEEVVAELDVDACVQWLPVLLDCAAGERNSQNDYLPTVVPKYRVLAPAICRIAAILLTRDRVKDNLDIILDALEYLFAVSGQRITIRSDIPFQDLSAALASSTFVKSALVERRIALLDKEGRSEHRVVFSVMHPLQFGDGNSAARVFFFNDLNAACERIMFAVSPRARRIAYEIAREIFRMFEDQEERQSAVGEVTKTIRGTGDKELIAETSMGLRKRLRGLVYRFRHNDMYRYSYKLRRFKHNARAIYRRAQDFLLFIRKAPRIRNADERRILEWEVRNSLNEPGRKTIDDLRGDYGSTIANWFEHGYSAFWRRYDIKQEDYRTYSAIAGLAGLALEAERGPISATPEEARRAFSYAFCSLNNFPDWTAHLVDMHPGPFRQVFSSLLKEELHVESGDQDISSSSLSHVAHGGIGIRAVAAPMLLRAVQSQPPRKTSNLELAVQVVARAGVGDAEETRTLFREGFERAATEFDFASAWIWLDALFVVDADEAWTVLSGFFRNRWNGAAGSLLVQFLGRERRHVARAEEWQFERNSLPRNAGVLGHLVKASHLAWPPERDPHHEDVYSPGVADRASKMRRYYLEWLVQLNSSAALEALDLLLADPELFSHRETFLYNRDRLIRASSRRPEFTPAKTVEFLNDLSKAPTSVWEFRELVVRYMKALLYKLAHSDDDEAAVFRRGAGLEYDLRNWLAGRLREAGSKYFTVIREQEVALENRPDLRIHARDRTLGNVSVEIKLADKDHWKGDELLDKIESQLVDQYLNEAGTHTGIYLLASGSPSDGAGKESKSKKKVFSKSVNGEPVSFAQLVAMATERAGALNGSLGGDKAVEVLSVDFCAKPDLAP
ncbi:MAG: hypothetical protein U0942_05550 [Parvibaculum sp.]|uniref:hypothetical protein n=1 Tax=Parvibaculum sp. TaxID=2024848 RepID=UPI002ABB2855|nr:hypothetical protein [Parvibaculum sp.]MDZ4380784.1 hypothetical protein [Parvibaculum sp.]